MKVGWLDSMDIRIRLGWSIVFTNTSCVTLGKLLNYLCLNFNCRWEITVLTSWCCEK